MKRFLILFATCVVGLTIGLVLAPFHTHRTAARSIVGHPIWASQATTIPDIVAEADIIVRVHVDHDPKVRKLKQWLPIDSPSDDKKFYASIMPFTDTNMRILEVYKGSIGKHITVLQTGGELLATDGDPAMHVETHDDPIFMKGSEHVLFLKNISGDAVHGQGRQLYVIVNPAGRYAVEGTRVNSPAEFPDWFTPPADLDELLGQIRQALSNQ